MKALEPIRPLPQSANSHPDQHPALLYLAGLRSPHSQRNLRRYLDQVAGLLSGGRLDAVTLDWSLLRFQHLTAVRARLAEHYAASTVNGALSAVRGVLKVSWKLGHMSAEDYHRAAAVPNLSERRLPAGRDLARDEILALLADCRRTAAQNAPRALRDAAMIALLYATGLRRAEVVALALADYDAETGGLRVRRGKGHADRALYVANRPKALLDAWLAQRGQDPGAIFRPVTRGGRIQPRALTDQAVYNMLRERARRAGLPHMTPHDLRRTFVGDALDLGIDLATVADIAGHASADTTRRYDRRDDRARAAAARKIDL